MKKKFKARLGSPFSVKDAQKIGEELEKIKSEDVLNPTTIVERAKNPKSVLHQYFDWDDSEAADKWRLQQARNITNHIIEVTIIQGEEIEHRGFFSVQAKNEQDHQYVSFAEVVKNKDYKKQLLNEMEGTLQNLLRMIKLFSSME